MLTICFTGHRPEKLGGYNWNTVKNRAIMNKLKNQIIDIINSSDEKQFHFIFGGALGVDQMAFDIVQDITYNDIVKNVIYNNQKLNAICFSTEIALPFLKQDSKWIDSSRIKWRQQLNKANIITEVDKLEKYKIKGYEELIYYPAKMQKRNEYMVDNSDIVIAVWDGTKGGTYNCVKYAQKQGKRIIRINPKEMVG